MGSASTPHWSAQLAAANLELLQHIGPADAMCITWINPGHIAIEDAVTLLGADSNSGQSVTYQQGADLYWEDYDLQDEGGGVVICGPSEGCLVMVEPNGWRGSIPETIQALSMGERDVVNVFSNVNRGIRLHWSRNGRIITAIGVDPWENHGDMPHALDHLLSDLPIREPASADSEVALQEPSDGMILESLPVPAYLEVAFRIVGHRLSLAWLESRIHECYIIP